MTESPRPSRNGDIVNGYRWDGRQWVPLTSGPATYPGPQPQPGAAMNGYRTQLPRAPRAVWVPPGRTASAPPRAGGWAPPPAAGLTPPHAAGLTPPHAAGWTPPPAPGWTPPPAAGWTPARARVSATRGGKPTWLLWALLALVVVIVVSVVVSDGGSPQAGDTDVKAGVAVIARGCSAFAGTTGSGPGVSDVRPDGAVAQYVLHWPTNPFTGRPMAPGTQPGDYRFSTAIRMPGGEYRGYVSAVLSNGETYSVEYRC